MSKTNLLQETLTTLESHLKSPTDVLWCGNTEAWSTWDDFAQAADFNYDSGYGGNEIALNLKIVGDNWWLERGEYDGSEWWEFKTSPTKPEVYASEAIKLIKERLYD